MIALEHRARSFFLQCRASARCIPLLQTGPGRSLQRCGLATAASVESRPSFPNALETKPYFVTSPIFYVNSAPHVGHLYTLVLTDILKRWAVLCGDERATLLTGTDEHGLKIQKAAQKANTDVKLFCDHHSQQFRALCDAANISYDRFIRTTDGDHKAAVEYFWTELNRAGYIYEATHEGWYCVSDETFYPETQVRNILDPSTGDTKIVSIETGKEVEWTSETNYHFKLSAFQEPLLRYYSENPKAIIPKQRMAFIMKEIEGGLNDLSISRPTSRLQWGIRVPGDESQTIYVWLDALINYLTMTGYPFHDRSDPNWLWPANCQVIGKDIIRFHTIYWPAFLMALGLPPPKQFLTHAHWTMNNAKMSKSAGNGVNPFFAMERYGVDSIRFYMAYNGGIVDDAMYENSKIAETYKHVLRDGYGNLLHRVFKSKNFNVREAVRLVGEDQKGFSDFLAQDEIDGHGDDVKSLHQGIQQLCTQIASTRNNVRKWMAEPNPRTAVTLITELIRSMNKFFHNSALWKRIKSDDATERRIAQYGLYASAEAIRVISILLQPIMPERTQFALDLMQVSPSMRTFAHAQLGADFAYGPPAVEPGVKGSPEVIFPVLLSDN